MKPALSLAIAFLIAAPAAVAMGEPIPYQNSGQPWIDAGPLIWSEDATYKDSRQELQVWKTNHFGKQLLYWTRWNFKKSYWEKQLKKYPQLKNPFLDPRRPFGPYLADCPTLKVSWLRYNVGPENPPLESSQEDPLQLAKLACQNQGIETP